MRTNATTENSEHAGDDYGAYSENHKHVPEKVFSLQRKLYAKAKSEPSFRFYSLYGHLSRPVVLQAALSLVLANDGGPGVDGVTCASITSDDKSYWDFIQNLEQELSAKSYRPAPVLRCFIDKGNGKKASAWHSHD